MKKPNSITVGQCAGLTIVITIGVILFISSAAAILNEYRERGSNIYQRGYKNGYEDGMEASAKEVKESPEHDLHRGGSGVVRKSPSCCVVTTIKDDTQ